MTPVAKYPIGKTVSHSSSVGNNRGCRLRVAVEGVSAIFRCTKQREGAERSVVYLDWS